MARRKGFFAELQRQSAQAQRLRQQQATAAARAEAQARRQYEAAAKQAERARAQADRAQAAEQKAAAREAQRLYEEARKAEVEAMNSELAARVHEIESLLQATLDVDDYVDLEQLRKVAEHPPFPRADLEIPSPPPVPLQAPPEPQFVEPPPPSGLGGLFGKKKHAEAVAQAQAAFAEAHAAWQAEVDGLPMAQLRQMQAYQETEQRRQAELAAAREAYDAECRAREQEVEQQNAELDDLIRGLAARDEDAVQEYIDMVLGNSVYPESFTVRHEHHFDAALRELALTVLIPGPSEMPAVKEYRYVKAKDEVTPSPLPPRDQKDRYASAVHQVALRTIHEIFEADRDGIIQTITLAVATDTVNRATGLMDHVELAAVAVDRDTFLTFDLAQVVPSETLKLLKASVSKDPFSLASIDTSKGVRG